MHVAWCGSGTARKHEKTTINTFTVNSEKHVIYNKHKKICSKNGGQWVKQTGEKRFSLCGKKSHGGHVSKRWKVEYKNRMFKIRITTRKFSKPPHCCASSHHGFTSTHQRFWPQKTSVRPIKSSCRPSAEPHQLNQPAVNVCGGLEASEHVQNILCSLTAYTI